MHQPATAGHGNSTFQVIFRRVGGVKNWNVYVNAETAQDAEREARRQLAYDRCHSLESDLGLTADADWQVAEINILVP